MSFILDALRKSEHERQRGAVPGISHVPFAAPRRDLPKWAYGVIGVLVIAVIALGGAWLSSLRGSVGPTPTPTPTPQAQTPNAATVPLEVPAERRELSRPARTADPGSLASAVTSPTTAPSNRATPPPTMPRAPAVDTTAAPSSAREAPAPSRPADSGEPTLPSAAALAAEGIVVPNLRLELHAYSDHPNERFVFINGRKYVEGDRLPEGPQVVAIEPAGAVLLHQGRRFLLAPN